MIVLPGHPRFDPFIEIRAERLVKLPKARTTLCGLKKYVLFVDCPGSYNPLKIKVMRTNGVARPPSADLEVELSGNVGAPVVRPFVLPPLTKEVVIAVEGFASPSSAIRSIEIRA